MIRIYCQFCKHIVDTSEDKGNNNVTFYYCSECKNAIGYSV